MKISITGISLLLIFTLGALPLRAENKSIPDPDVSIGVGGSYGFSDTVKVRGNTSWDTGYTCGAGLIIEKMFGNHFGLHSGIWYSRTEMDFRYFDDTLGYDVPAVSTWQAVTMPLYFMLSVNSSRVSLVFLGGFNLSQNIFSELTSDDIALDNSTSDVLNYVSYFQFGLASGINLKFRIGRFFDFFVGGIAELYLLDMLPGTGNSDSVNYPYNYRIISGVLFRTNLFPIEID